MLPHLCSLCWFFFWTTMPDIEWSVRSDMVHPSATIHIPAWLDIPCSGRFVIHGGKDCRLSAPPLFFGLDKCQTLPYCRDYHCIFLNWDCHSHWNGKGIWMLSCGFPDISGMPLLVFIHLLASGQVGVARIGERMSGGYSCPTEKISTSSSSIFPSLPEHSPLVDIRS